MSNENISRLSVAELKQLVARPDVVEMHDVTARDPRLEFRPSRILLMKTPTRLLVHLKSTRNTVPVPRHWCFKRKYLQVLDTLIYCCSNDANTHLVSGETRY